MFVLDKKTLQDPQLFGSFVLLPRVFWGYPSLTHSQMFMYSFQENTYSTVFIWGFLAWQESRGQCQYPFGKWFPSKWILYVVLGSSESKMTSQTPNITSNPQKNKQSPKKSQALSIYITFLCFLFFLDPPSCSTASRPA